jgi:hypothetical protein
MIWCYTAQEKRYEIGMICPILATKEIPYGILLRILQKYKHGLQKNVILFPTAALFYYKIKMSEYTIPNITKALLLFIIFNMHAGSVYICRSDPPYYAVQYIVASKRTVSFEALFFVYYRYCNSAFKCESKSYYVAQFVSFLFLNETKMKIRFGDKPAPLKGTVSRDF